MWMFLCLHLDVSVSLQCVSNAVKLPLELQHLQNSYSETQGVEIRKVVCQAVLFFPKLEDVPGSRNERGQEHTHSEVSGCLCRIPAMPRPVPGTWVGVEMAVSVLLKSILKCSGCQLRGRGL